MAKTESGGYERLGRLKESEGKEWLIKSCELKIEIGVTLENWVAKRKRWVAE